jgi:hypothetical protein
VGKHTGITNDRTNSTINPEGIILLYFWDLNKDSITVNWTFNVISKCNNSNKMFNIKGKRDEKLKGRFETTEKVHLKRKGSFICR